MHSQDSRFKTYYANLVTTILTVFWGRVKITPSPPNPDIVSKPMPKYTAKNVLIETTVHKKYDATGI